MLILTTALSSILLAQDPPKPAPQPPPDHPARASFVANCAQCHGETGDGKGTTKLDRPARSFQDGGFSYGNTPEALLRTITFGIPGTPMPSFEKALNVEQRKSLAEYVLLLGPPVEKTDPKASVMVVKDKPLVVRGKLPPLVPGGKETVRGLLIGTPEGLAFEYDVANVRLLGVLTGDFVDRADWRGRGGDALVPLGKVADVRSVDEDRDLDVILFSQKERQLLGTTIDSDGASVRYGVRMRDTGELANVVETPRAFSCSMVAGYARRLSVVLPYAQHSQSHKPKLSERTDGTATRLRCVRYLVGSLNKLVIEEVVLPGVMLPSEPMERQKQLDAFAAECERQ